jgi:protein-S-isoprenylcysteine O-methyltransferase Ste14
MAHRHAHRVAVDLGAKLTAAAHRLTCRHGRKIRVGRIDPLLYATLALWAALELGLRIVEAAQHRGGIGRDRGTRVVIALALGGAVTLAFLARAHVPSARVPAALRAIGLVAIWCGLVIRAWAVLTLGRAFRTTVEVDADQPVICTGPYAYARHPSYTGLLLIVAGTGLAVGNWLGLAACLLLPLPALVLRIGVEERELVRVLGEPYRSYQARTKRLLPGVW